MPRIRYLKPEFFVDDELSALPIPYRLLYAGLWCLADKAGRLPDRARWIKVLVFPYDDVDIEAGLTALNQPKAGSGLPFIVRYQADGNGYIQILAWDEHQRPHHTERDSIIPPPTPPLGKGKGMGKGMGKGKQLNPRKKINNGVITVKPLVRRRKRNQAEKLPPISFDPNTREFQGLSQVDIDQWTKVFPTVDVKYELQKAAVWWAANPEKQKRNIHRFLASWMSRQYEHGGSRNTNGQNQAEKDEGTVLTGPGVCHYPPTQEQLDWLESESAKARLEKANAKPKQ